MRSDIVDFAALARGPQIIGKRRQDAEPLGVAVVGYGYWGPNMVRNVIERPEFELRAPVRDRARRARARSRRRLPGIADAGQTSTRSCATRTVDAVVVATPPRTHHALVKRGARGGQARARREAAGDDERRRGRPRRRSPTDGGLVLMPGHTFLYSPPVNKVRDLIREDVLGEVYFVTSSRMNLGKYQPDGVIMDLAPHDLSILLYWLEQPVVEVAATARSIFQAEMPETAFLTLTFAGGAHGQRPDLVAGPAQGAPDGRSSAAAGWSSTTTRRTDEPVRVYDRGMEFSTPGELRRVPAHLPHAATWSSRGSRRPSR